MACCQAITLTNVDFSSKVFCGIHQGQIQQEVLMNFICTMHLEIIF